MNPSNIADIIIAVTALFGMIGACTAFFYRRGANDKELTIAMRQNTTATEKLSNNVDRVTETLIRHGETLVEHDARLKAGGL